MRPGQRLPFHTALLLMAGLTPVVPLRAQTVFSGGVLDDSTKAPLAGVEVVVSGRQQAVVTDAGGRFVVTGLPAGIHQVLFRSVGFRPVRVRLILTDTDTVEQAIFLTRAVAELAPLEVTATSVPRGMEKFAERRAAGRGTFFDAKDLRAAEHRRVSEVLGTVAGVRGQQHRDRGSQRQKTLMASRRGGAGLSGQPCYMAVWLDGVRLYSPVALGSALPPDINEYRVADLEAIEVYPGPGSLPAELGGTGGMCGAVVMWSRRR